MAKKIRFALEMKDGVEVRTIEELRENFSLEKVMFYFSNGKLVTWLKDRYLDDLAAEVEALEADNDSLPEKLCEIFDVEYDKEAMEDLEKAAEINRKKELLKNYTTEDKYFEVVEKIAFDQDELYDLLDEDESTIYLCGEKFSVPISKNGVTYIGVNKPMVVISSKEIVDFGEKNISFENIVFDEKYQELLNECDSETEEEEIDVDNLEGLDKAIALLKNYSLNGKKDKEICDALSEMLKREDYSSDAVVRLYINAIKYDVTDVLDILEALDNETKEKNRLLLDKAFEQLNLDNYKRYLNRVMPNEMKEKKETIDNKKRLEAYSNSSGDLFSKLTAFSSEKAPNVEIDYSPYAMMITMTMSEPIREAIDMLLKMQKEIKTRDAGDSDKIKQILKTFEEYMNPKENLGYVHTYCLEYSGSYIGAYQLFNPGWGNSSSFADDATEHFYESLKNHTLEVIQIINNLDEETKNKNKNKIQLVLEILKDLKRSIRNVAGDELNKYFEKLKEKHRNQYTEDEIDSFVMKYSERYEKSVSNCFKEQIIAPIVDLLNRIK